MSMNYDRKRISDVDTDIVSNHFLRKRKDVFYQECVGGGKRVRSHIHLAACGTE